MEKFRYCPQCRCNRYFVEVLRTKITVTLKCTKCGRTIVVKSRR